MYVLYFRQRQLLPVDHGIAARPNADPLNRHTEELLDELYVVFALLWQLTVRATFGDVFLPARKRFVLNLDFVAFQERKIRC